MLMIEESAENLVLHRQGPGFLQECAVCIDQVLGNGILDGNPGRFAKHLWGRWSPTFKHGMPGYDSRRWTWDFWGVENSNHDVQIEVTSDGRLVLCEPEDDGLYLELKLKTACELAEILELLQQLTPDNCERSSFQDLPWSSVVQDVFATIPVEKDLRLTKFSWAGWEAKWPKLLEPLRVFFHGHWEGINKMQYSTWRDWLARYADLNSMQFTPISENDLVFSPEHGFQSPHTAVEECDDPTSCEPKLVLRLKPQHSNMYFLDVLEHMAEGEMLFQTLQKRPEKVSELLAQTKIKYPANRLLQIRSSVELRVAMAAYEYRVRALMTRREPAQEIHDCYHLRTQHVELLHTEYLRELESIQHPLPFMIEYPLRRFRRTDDALMKIKCGQELLTLLAKLPLFLALEESRAHPQSQALTASIESALFGKAASDGTLMQRLRELQDLVSEKQLSLPWFGTLLDCYHREGERHLRNLVEPLNRFKHPPHDHRKFLKALETEVPFLVELFRGSLGGLLFIVPEGQNQRDGRHVVSARVLMGFDSDFLRQDFVVTAPFEAFPAGELVVIDPGGSRALDLSRFFKSQPIHTVSLDIGVFDRVEHGRPEYVFIRGLDREE